MGFASNLEKQRNNIAKATAKISQIKGYIREAINGLNVEIHDIEEEITHLETLLE